MQRKSTMKNCILGFDKASDISVLCETPMVHNLELLSRPENGTRTKVNESMLSLVKLAELHELSRLGPQRCLLPTSAVNEICPPSVRVGIGESTRQNVAHRLRLLSKPSLFFLRNHVIPMVSATCARMGWSVAAFLVLREPDY